VIEFWPAILIGSLAVYSWKILGYLLPESFSRQKTVVDLANQLTVGLLAALCTVETIAGNHGIAIDSRIPALGVAAILYWRKVPYLVTVLVAAIVAAALRYFLHWA
jgi:branched-subunit amino acid transport protein